MNPATLIAALTEQLDFGWRSASSAAVTPFFSAGALAPALGNHLWQSTLFALAAALLTLTLRKNQARARYWLWLTASLKFFIPFSWLVALGSYLTWRHTSATDTSLYYTIEEISQPFTQATNSTITAVASTAAHAFTPTLPAILPALLAALWLCGFLAVLLTWCLRWRKISAAIRNSEPVRAGRELETLRRLERTAGLRQRVEMLLSRTMLEPGIFGMARPVLLWPEGISQHLETPHLEAVLAHELWHVRRRDNLAAALHMLVEAVFWFHPLVWWLGARLVDERERACDEEVLELGGEPRIYAESILKVCEFCVGSPLACVSGVTGADLKKRMVHIMSEHVARKLDLSKKLLLTAAGMIAIAAPIVFGLIHATPSRAQSQNDASATTPRFESFTIAASQPSDPENPGEKHMTKMMFGPDKGFVASNITLQSVIQDAYGMQANQIIGAPDWLNSDRFDIQGKVSPSQAGDSTPFVLHGPDAAKVALDTAGGVNKMLQAALADHTKLVVHTETKVLPTYVLVVAEGGSKLQPAPAEDANENANSRFGPRMINGVRLKINDKDSAHVMDLEAHGMSADDLAGHLARELGQPVINKTGLTGRYNFQLHFTKDATQPGSADASTDSASTEAPSLFTAVQEQLGLKLEPQKAPTQVLVIDHIEKPTTEQSENKLAPVSEE